MARRGGCPSWVSAIRSGFAAFRSGLSAFRSTPTISEVTARPRGFRACARHPERPNRLQATPLMPLTSALNNLTISKKTRCIACARRAENALGAHTRLHAHIPARFLVTASAAISLCYEPCPPAPEFPEVFSDAACSLTVVAGLVRFLATVPAAERTRASGTSSRRPSCRQSVSRGCASVTTCSSPRPSRSTRTARGRRRCSLTVSSLSHSPSPACLP